MPNVLIISGHPALSQSVANRAILEEIGKALPQAQIRRLDALYPDFRIDVPAEQQALVWADIIVWQFPLYWYSAPALMRKWLEDSFTHGFSHGSKGTALHGKKLILSFTAGAPEAAYTHEGFMGKTMEEVMTPFAVTAKLTGMQLQPLVYSAGISFVPGDADPERLAAARAIAQNHARRLLAAIEKAA
ncbi:MAG TPA: NAD(P)H dehydrogenase [Sutterella sp.]|nr:NAD(P)H dehydrogenase [Sutterella sp.]